MRCAPRASNGPNHLGLCALWLQITTKVLNADGSFSHRREFCHFADAPSSSVLKRLLKEEGGAAE